MPILVTAAGLLLCPPASALDVARLEDPDIESLDVVLLALKPLITEKRQAGLAGLLTWEELYAPLTDVQQELLGEFRTLRGASLGATSHYFGENLNASDLVRVEGQMIRRNGIDEPLDPQYLPREVLRVYTEMMEAMAVDLGKRLLVESGYRSPAYQLYLFLYYLPTHDHSITETNRFVALPGHSEHGYPPRQAIDFINEAGINGEDQPEEFEVLPEYQWLRQHAERFGFALSYPRGNPHNTAFEPWHWHFNGVRDIEGTGDQGPGARVE